MWPAVPTTTLMSGSARDNEGCADGLGQPRVVRGVDGPEVEDRAVVLDPADHLGSPSGPDAPATERRQKALRRAGADGHRDRGPRLPRAAPPAAPRSDPD